jgi:hypothetical protein
MISCFIYKASRRAITYVSFVVFVLVAIVTWETIKTNYWRTAYQKVVIWPCVWEFFIEMILAVEASWLVLQDILNGTFKNTVSCGLSRRKYFFGQMGCVCVMITAELALASILYISNALNDAGFSEITAGQLLIYLLYLVLIWVRHMAVVVLCASIGFMVRAIHALVGSVAVVFAIIFLDAVTNIKTEWTYFVEIMKYTPLGSGKMLGDQIYATGSIPIGSSILITLPTIAITIVVAVISMRVFEKADLN